MVSFMVQPMHDPALKEQVKTSMLQHATVRSGERDGRHGGSAIWAEDKINVPTLASWPRQPAWNKEYEAYVHGLIPNLEFQVWDGVSHFLMMDKPDEFNSTLSAFLVKIKFLKQ